MRTTQTVQYLIQKRFKSDSRKLQRQYSIVIKKTSDVTDTYIYIIIGMPQKLGHHKLSIKL